MATDPEKIARDLEYSASQLRKIGGPDNTWAAVVQEQIAIATRAEGKLRRLEAALEELHLRIPLQPDNALEIRIRKRLTRAEWIKLGEGSLILQLIETAFVEDAIVPTPEQPKEEDATHGD